MSTTTTRPGVRRPGGLLAAGLRMLGLAVLLAAAGGGTALLTADAASAGQAPASARQAPERTDDRTDERTDDSTDDSTDAAALLPLGGGVAAFGTASVLLLRRFDLSDAE